jgi:outer membrane protein TolC
MARIRPFREQFSPWRVSALASLAAALGCQHYQPKPASPDAVAAALAPIPDRALVQAAASLSHPALRPVSIPPDGSLTPDAAAVVAVLQNPSIRAARSRRGVAEAQLLQAGILPNPQLAAGMDFPVAGATEGTVNAFSLGATWDVTSLISREQNRLAAQHEGEAIDLEIAWQEWQAAMGAKLHATRVIWLSLQHDELARQVEEAEHAEKGATDNVQEGLVTVIESEAAAALVQKRRAALLATEASLVSEFGFLREAIGVPADASLRIVAEPPRQSPPLPSADEVADAVDHGRLDIAALRAGYASEEAKLHAAVLSQFPKIGLGITRARDTTDVGTIGFGITLDLPIFDRGQGRIAVEKATRQQLFDELAARSFEARSDAQRARAELATTGPQVEQARRTADRLSALANRLGEARVRGDADIVQLAQARNDAAEATVDLMRLQQQEAELRIALDVATGQLIGDSRP